MNPISWLANFLGGDFMTQMFLPLLSLIWNNNQAREGNAETEKIIGNAIADWQGLQDLGGGYQDFVSNEYIPQLENIYGQMMNAWNQGFGNVLGAPLGLPGIGTGGPGAGPGGPTQTSTQLISDTWMSPEQKQAWKDRLGADYGKVFDPEGATATSEQQIFDRISAVRPPSAVGDATTVTLDENGNPVETVLYDANASPFAALEQTLPEALQGYAGRFSAGMGELDKLSDEASRRIDRDYGNLLTGAEQSLVDRGLYNTSTLGATQRGVEEGRTRAQTELDDVLARERLNWGSALSNDFLQALERGITGGVGMMGDYGGNLLNAMDAGWTTSFNNLVETQGMIDQLRGMLIPEAPPMMNPFDTFGAMGQARNARNRYNEAMKQTWFDQSGLAQLPTMAIGSLTGGLTGGFGNALGGALFSGLPSGGGGSKLPPVSTYYQEPRYPRGR
jgi:hypothetical protein